jgi:hypothetical protein
VVPRKRAVASPLPIGWVLLALVLCVTASWAGALPAEAHPGWAASRAARPRSQTQPLFGVTVDSINGIGAVVAAERSLPDRPTTRVYMSIHEPASYYAAAVLQLDSAGTVMGELLDSSDARHIGVAAFQRRVESYLSVLGSTVGIWEVGNEVNGDWTGRYASGAAKLQEAYADVAATRAPTALTLYANEYGPDHCGDGDAELTPLQYSEVDVSPAVRDGLTYVLESYYPTQCDDVFPTDAQVASELEQLRTLYPHALLGFGEVGLPQPVRPRTLAAAERVMSWAYGLDPQVAGYVGGYFWWYAREDAFVGKAPLRGALGRAFDAEQAALMGPQAPTPTGSWSTPTRVPGSSS